MNLSFHLIAVLYPAFTFRQNHTMKRALPIVMIAAIAVTGCQSADPKAVATEMCACMEPVKAKMSAKTEAIYTKAMKNPSTFQQVTQEEVMAIQDETEQQKVRNELIESTTLMQGAKFQTCITDIDKKHKVRKTEEKEKQKEVIGELEKQCPLAATLLRAGLQQQGKY